MTSKEKAEELINYFITLRPAKLSDYTQIYQPSAKLCALKVCEEVLSYMGSDRGTEFWEEVKQEIEKL
jgi:hypothetical protein